MEPQNEERAGLARRVREVRLECYGDRGVTGLAESMGLPARTWLNYEAGVTMPATAVLRFIDLTGASPGWLLTGRGARYVDDCRGVAPSDPGRDRSSRGTSDGIGTTLLPE